MSKDFRTHLAADAKIQKLHRLIAEGDQPSAGQLADKLEVSIRTVNRYLDALRNQGAPLVYHHQKRGWYFKDPFWQLPPMRLTEGDLLAFFIAEQSLKFTGRDEFAKRLRTSLARLATLLPEHVSINLAEFSAGISFQSLPFAPVDPQMLETITTAAKDQQVVEFDYYSPHKREKTHRVVHVHRVHNFAGDWFAISFDPKAADFRPFHISRISQLRTTSEYFEPQKNWNANEYLSSGFFMMQGGKETEVRLVFDAYQSQWIRERHFLHPDEQREELPDGSLRISFKIGENALDAVARYCLGYADHCLVESPPKLKAKLKERLNKGQELNK